MPRGPHRVGGRSHTQTQVAKLPTSIFYCSSFDLCDGQMSRGRCAAILYIFTPNMLVIVMREAVSPTPHAALSRKSKDEPRDHTNPRRATQHTAHSAVVNRES